MTLKVRGSASGFMWGRTVFTDYDGACLRKVLLSSRGAWDGQIDPKHQIRGKFNEEEYERQLIGAGYEFKREVFVQDTIPSTSVPFQGSIDYLVSGTECDEVHELKSTESKNKLREIKSGKYVTENLAQAIAYMITVNTVVGKLIYTYFEMNSSTCQYEQKYTRTFEILIDSSGRIVVDNVPTKWTVYDQLLHRNTSARVVENGIVWDRPHNHELLWGSPCKNCPFKEACDKYDLGEFNGTDEYIQYAKTSLTSKKESK